MFFQSSFYNKSFYNNLKSYREIETTNTFYYIVLRLNIFLGLV